MSFFLAEYLLKSQLNKILSRLYIYIDKDIRRDKVFKGDKDIRRSQRFHPDMSIKRSTRSIHPSRTDGTPIHIKNRGSFNGIAILIHIDIKIMINSIKRITVIFESDKVLI